jgi:hypothetical protein
MKKFLMALAVLALVSAPAMAGPNANGTLLAHDTGLAYTVDSTSYPSDPPVCGENGGTVDAQIDLDFIGVWKIYAAFPDGSSPRLKALPMGATFSAQVFVVAGGLPDPVNDFEVPQGGWPTVSGGGTGVSFGVVKTALMNECYWFGGYGYGAPGVFQIAPHPVQPMLFIDDSVPPQEDPIVALGSLGFGQEGNIACPGTGPVEGACCFPNGDCQLLLPDACLGAGGAVVGGPCDPNPCPIPQEGACCVEEDCFIYTESACIAAGGQFLGVGVSCDPNPCVIPVEETSWGQIKANYR